ncbi:hypothetical protein ACFX1R_035837 [Malus domestica]
MGLAKTCFVPPLRSSASLRRLFLLRFGSSTQHANSPNGSQIARLPLGEESRSVGSGAWEDDSGLIRTVPSEHRHLTADHKKGLLEIKWPRISVPHHLHPNFKFPLLCSFYCTSFPISKREPELDIPVSEAAWLVFFCKKGEKW